ncbi:AfsR/SARP family transcriptional regulator [Actinomycetospora flava]|uniref:BTAD domain-containing putative transcriptional regulator n=1 Tax=Actinomycetospora flava TaxID=3129232 RepID=A0ABU8M6B9_9PSEU
MGLFCLRVDGRVVDLPGTSKRLVAVLALQGRTSRSRLAGTLWPEASEPRALASLRTVIWRVNQAAPQLVLTRGDAVEVDARAQVDVRAFVARATAVLHGRDGNVPTWPLTEDDLLVDWDEPWLTHERERLHQLRLHLLEAVAERLSEDGRYGLAIEAALAAVRCDALRESAHRTLIRAHLAEGNVGEARRAYRNVARLLDQELGLAPGAETTALLAVLGPREVGGG